jgi:hypothetical protein
MIDFFGLLLLILVIVLARIGVSRQDTEYSIEQHIKPTVCLGRLRINNQLQSTRKHHYDLMHY